MSRSRSCNRTTPAQRGSAATASQHRSPWASITNSSTGLLTGPLTGLPTRPATAEATATSVEVTPLPGEPTTSRSPSVGDQRSASRRCSSGRSTTPTTPTTPGSLVTEASSASRTSLGSGACQGDRCGEQPMAVAALTTAVTSGSIPPLATWNVTRSSGPRRITARPGIARDSSAGEPSPTTSSASARSCMRRATRRLVFARISSLITPLGRCVARMRCTPRLRPRWAMFTSEWRNDGNSTANAANSSTTTSRRGSTGAAQRRRASVRSMAPRSRRTRSRWVSSARRLRNARSANRSSRSVTMPTTCGSGAHTSNVAPPL